VQDKRTSEWAYIMGGCKNYYNPIVDAVREFREETNNCLLLNSTRFNYSKTFRTSYRPPELLQQDKKEHIYVTSYYHVFEVILNENEVNDLLINYHNNTSNDETKDILFSHQNAPIWSITKYNLWSFMNIVYKFI